MSISCVSTALRTYGHGKPIWDLNYDFGADFPGSSSSNMPMSAVGR